MVERPERGLLDTSVVIDLEAIDVAQLPQQAAISAVTMAELAAGPAAATDEEERARRQDRLQRAEAMFDPIPFDLEAARAYARVYASVRRVGREPRRRFADLLIAAVAVSQGIPLLSRNAADFSGLEHLLQVIEV